MCKVFAECTQLASREFVQAISDMLSYRPQPTHALLDWMASMAPAISPIQTPAESTQRFVQHLFEQYHLAEHRRYEIKRRIHSLVESSTSIIQGDPMSVEQQPSSSNTPTASSSSSPIAMLLRSTSIFPDMSFRKQHFFKPYVPPTMNNAEEAHFRNRLPNASLW
jgi:hypothetical protein